MPVQDPIVKSGRHINKTKLPAGTLVPARFWLIDAAEGLAFDATVAWRRAPEVGVSLASPIDLTVPLHDSLHRRLHALWVEVSPGRGSS